MKRFSLKFKRLNAVTLADHARDAGQWELATQLYREALDCNPYDPPIWVQYGHALKESGQLRDPDKLAQAGAAYRRALSLDPGAADPHLQLGHVLKLLGKTDDAKASYVRAFALDPSMPYPLEELRGLGWSEAELSELRSVVLADDHDQHSAAPARPSRSSTSTGLLISTRRPAPELNRPTAHNAFSISRVDVHSLLARRAAPESPSIWNASSADAPSIAREEVFSAGTTVSERAVSAAGAQTEVPLSEQMAVVNAVILAQRWDLDGVKEQLQDAVEEKRQLEALLTARISALETELRDVYASGDATSSLPEIDQAMPARVHQVPDTADMGRGYERLSRFLENGAGCEGQNPRRSSEGPVPFYLSEARNLDQNPHPLFDPVYYRAQAATRGLIVSDPLAHFAEVGGVLGLSPHPLFDAAYYLDANPDVKATGDDPLRHYLLHGDREGRNPHRLFSTAYYKLRSGIGDNENALIHYVLKGGISIDPHECFDTQYYLSMLGRPLPSGVTALGFYLADSNGMKVSPHPMFDQDYYRGQLSEADRDCGPLLLHYLEQPPDKAASPHPIFDLEFFHDGGGYPQPALLFYLSIFWAMASDGYRLHEMQFPEVNRYFCSISYLLDHPDLRNGTEIPLVHFIKRGGLITVPGRHDELDNNGAAIEKDSGDIYEPVRFATGELMSVAREQANRVRYLGPNNHIFSCDSGIGDMNLEALFEEAQPRATPAVKSERLACTVTESRRLAIYALYAPDGRLKMYHKAMLAALQEARYATVVVNSTFTGAVRLHEEIGGLAQGIILRRGDGRDFASWVIALTHLAPALAHVDHLLLLNDSLIGPFGKLGSVIKAMEDDRADFKGLTESNEIAHHLQSSLLMLSRDAVFSRPFLSFLLRFVPGKSRKQGIEDGEIELSQQMMAANVAASAQIPYTEVTQSWLAQVPEYVVWAHALPEKLEETGLYKLFSREVAGRFVGYLEDWLLAMHPHIWGGGPVNPQQICWDLLLRGGSFPFLKKELVLLNPLRVPTLVRICGLFPPEQRSQVAELLRDLVEAAGALPRSYLRLSSSLLDAMVS